ncbi:hypothetical protein QRX60_04140 [Amycolatopsis mongoliensis]|uniref:Uncharacterized protein n=1 Tax=Amycolatopsis mongoliensis TaxID=715475 RepID=A0A9Y2JU88_9PSEU|nr:hypothetical protein [Amycolatopsis sp. 4-36]WIY03064.1 hypothetical protein QRX60_04140 [Amycolatopsis sp. 4-36]
MSWTDAWRWLWGSVPPLEPVGDPVHRTILAVGIDGFSTPDRTNLHRLTLRAGLYRAFQLALAESGVRWNDCDHADLGDGVLVLAPAGYPKAVFSELLPAALTKSLAEHNRCHRPPEQLGLRLVLHAGEVTYDTHGSTGSAIVHAFRLLNSAVLKENSACSGGGLALIASGWYHEEIIRHSPLSCPDYYEPVFVREKETAARAWIRLVGPDGPDQRASG